jgi:hypothetical protein
MYHYLQQHPAIFMPSVKEPHFFSTDVAAPRAIRDAKRYWALFADTASDQIVGEASATYLYSQQAAANIKEHCPSAKIVIMLRNPVDVMYSLYYQRVYNGIERAGSFIEALQQEQDRLTGQAPAEGAFPLYRAAVSFSKQVNRYKTLFAQANLHIILHDDLVRDTALVYRDLLRFLSVDDGFQPDFRVWNSGRQVRSQTVQMAVKRASLSRSVFRYLLPLAWRRKAASFVERWNVRDGYGPMSPDLYGQLQLDFVDEVERLGQLIGRDLSHWSQRLDWNRGQVA